MAAAAWVLATQSAELLGTDDLNWQAVTQSLEMAGGRTTQGGSRVHPRAGGVTARVPRCRGHRPVSVRSRGRRATSRCLLQGLEGLFLLGLTVALVATAAPAPRHPAAQCLRGVLPGLRELVHRGLLELRQLRHPGASAGAHAAVLPGAPRPSCGPPAESDALARSRRRRPGGRRSVPAAVDSGEHLGSSVRPDRRKRVGRELRTQLARTARGRAGAPLRWGTRRCPRSRSSA